MEVKSASVATLLSTYSSILAELRRREILRTNNPAEYLTAQTLSGELQENSRKSMDVVLEDGRRLQVKARVVYNPRNAGQRQLSPFRSFDFDDAVIVLFNGEYGIRQAAQLP